jgi:ATP-binding cassette, subfamily C, bacterial LapB
MLQDHAHRVTPQQGDQHPTLFSKALQSKGLPFLQAEWLICKASNTTQAAIQAYLKKLNIPSQVIDAPNTNEIAKLPASALCFDRQEELYLAGDIQNQLTSPPGAEAPTFTVAIVIQEPQARANDTEADHQSILQFWKQLRQSSWLTEALRAGHRHIGPIVGASILINILALAPTLFTVQVYDRIIPNQAWSSLWTLAFGIAICLAFEHLLKRSRHKLMEHSATVTDSICTQKLSNVLLGTRQSASTPSTLLQHLRSFESLREVITGMFLLSLIDLPFLALFLLVIGLIHPYFLLIAATVVIIHAVEVLRTHQKLAKLGNRQLEDYRNAQGDWIDSLQQLPTIQSHGVQDMFASRLNRTQMRQRISGNEIRECSFASTQLMQTLHQVAWISTMLLGTYLVIANTISIGGLIAATMLTMRCFAPLQKLQGQLIQTHAAQAGFEDLDKLMRQAPPEQQTLQRLPYIEHLQLKQLSVLKPGSRENSTLQRMLSDVDLELEAGSRVGIIGPTGSGKTTLLNLLAGQVKIQQGEYTINHLRHNLYSEVELGRWVGFAEQPPRLIRGNLLENITLHRPWVNPQDCLDIMDALGMKPWLNSLSEGLQHPIKSQGGNLSSGQKQLIALCRALVGNPQLLLLDEPTVCLDAHSEAKLIQYLNQLGPEVTVLFTTHRLNLLAACKKLVLMHSGQIASQGDKATVLTAAKAMEQQA